MVLALEIIALIIFVIFEVVALTILLKDPMVIENDQSALHGKTLTIITDIPDGLTSDDILEITNVATAFVKDYAEDLVKGK